MTTSESIATDEPNLLPATADAWAVVYLDVAGNLRDPAVLRRENEPQADPSQWIRSVRRPEAETELVAED